MAAPEYVPVKPMDDVRTYESPPRRPDPWMAARPGDLRRGQPEGKGFGHIGPDQGYGLLLAKRFVDQLRIGANERLDDVLSGALAVALKRASLLGRAPVIHDFTVAYTIWGYLDEHPADALVALRRHAFEEVALPGHYRERQRIAEAVPDGVLRRPHATVIEEHGRDWRSLLDVEALAPRGHG